MNALRRLTLVAALLAGSLAAPAAVEACPGCAEAQAGQGPGRANVVRGYQASIIFMMSMPFLIVGSFGGYVYLTVRRARKEGESPVSAEPAAPLSASIDAPSAIPPLK